MRLQRPRGIAQHLGIQRRQVAAEQQRGVVPLQRARQRTVHALAQVALALLRQRHAVRLRQAGEDGVRRIRRGAHLHRADIGLQRLTNGVLQQPFGERGRALRPQRRREPRLRLPGPRRLGEHAQRQLHR